MPKLNAKTSISGSIVETIAHTKSNFKFFLERTFDTANPTIACPKIDAIILCF